MKTVLMIAPYFVPRRRVGSLRPFRFAIHLKKLGWNPVVLTLSTPSQQHTKKEQELLEGIKIIQITPPFDRTAPSGSASGKKQTNSTSLINHFSSWIDKQIPTDSWIFLFRVKYRQIYSHVENINPDLIWSTGDPWSGLWLGEKLSSDLSLPFIADFRDPWTLSNVNLRARSAFSGMIDRRIEKRIIDRADKIVFTAQSAREIYQKEYSLPTEKTAVIYNSFEPALINFENGQKWDYEPEPDKLHLVFFGGFRRLSPAEPVIDSLYELVKNHSQLKNQLRVHSFGTLLPEESKRINSLGLRSVFVEHEPVLPEHMMTVFEKADLLLLSTDKNRTGIIPAKLWDYLASGKPILSILPNREVADILGKTGSGVQFNPGQKSDIARFLRKNIVAKQNGEKFFKDHANDREGNREYQSAHTAGQLAALLDEVSNGN